MSARAVIDLRLWVEGIDELDVWALVTEFQRRAAEIAPEGVSVRYTQIRDGSKTRGFEATMGLNRRERRRRR